MKGKEVPIKPIEIGVIGKERKFRFVDSYGLEKCTGCDLYAECHNEQNPINPCKENHLEDYHAHFEEIKNLYDIVRVSREDAESHAIRLPEPSGFSQVANEIIALQERKNTSYGNAFEQSCDKYGVVSALTRLNDKMNRLDALHKSSENEVFGESFTDTLTDLAAYAIMTIVWLKNRKK